MNVIAYNVLLLNLVPVLFKALLHGQKNHVLYSMLLIYILKQGHVERLGLQRDIKISSGFGALGPSKG
jgi:hypothetical protein